MMKNKNQGFSLVELIVVIGIMAVMIGIVGFSLSFLFSTEAKQAVQKVSGQLNETKTGAMSRYDEEMTLSYKTKDTAAAIPSDGYYVKRENWTIMNTTNLDKKSMGTEIRKVASKKVVITVCYDASSSIELGETHSLTISYDRASGALENAILDGNPITLSEIKFKSGLKEYSIAFTPETGKHVIQ